MYMCLGNICSKRLHDMYGYYLADFLCMYGRESSPLMYAHVMCMYKENLTYVYVSMVYV